jgi:hypothetical protein
VKEGHTDPIPSKRALRCFYFMRRIERTIKEGGYLTEELHIPKYVWYQKEAVIKEIDSKIKHFGRLKNKL